MFLVQIFENRKQTEKKKVSALYEKRKTENKDIVDAPLKFSFLFLDSAQRSSIFKLMTYCHLLS